MTARNFQLHVGLSLSRNLSCYSPFRLIVNCNSFLGFYSITCLLTLLVVLFWFFFLLGLASAHIL